MFDDPPTLGGTRIDESAPDLEAVRAQRKLQSPSLFGAHVLEVCAMADIVFLALHGRTGEDGQRAGDRSTCSASPTPAAVTSAAPSPWIRT